MHDNRPIKLKSIYWKLWASYGLMSIMLVMIDYVVSRSVDNMIAGTEEVRHTQEVIAHLKEVLTSLIDAETGQRGYLLTDDENYLEPYEAGIRVVYAELDSLKKLTADNHQQQSHIELMRPLVEEKLAELNRTIVLHKKDPGQALDLVKTNVGKHSMDQIRLIIKLMEEEEFRLLDLRSNVANQTFSKFSTITIYLTVFSIAIVCFVGVLISKNVGSLFRLLEHERASLVKSNQELDDFAYVASHNLKEPLRGISHYATFIAEDYDDKIDKVGKQKLKTINMLSKRLSNDIEALLRFSKVGRTELAFGDYNLNDIVDEVVMSLQATIEKKEIEIRIPERLPTVYCDNVRIREVFYNLIVNAIKYNDKDKKWIEIGCKNTNEGLAFYVQDNGIGIREKHLEKIFGIFKRLHGEEDIMFGDGTGAGLTIVKKIVERHNGKIWVNSVYNEGTTFCFTINADENIA